ncbi:MAG: hypothetical protein ACXW6K_07100, partial [Candidatus Binatia bacterium]
DWRAVCGRTARTVRRAGTAKAVPDPYQVVLRRISLDTRFRGYDGAPQALCCAYHPAHLFSKEVTKDTKASEIISPNFVLFVSFVVGQDFSFRPLLIANAQAKH